MLLKSVWKKRGPKITNQSWKRRAELENIYFLNSRLTIKSYKVLYCHINRLRSKKQNREPRNRLTLPWAIDFWQGHRKYFSKGREIFWTNASGTTWYPHGGRKRTLIPTSHNTWINMRWIIDLNIKTNIKQLLGEKKREYLCNLE